MSSNKKLIDFSVVEEMLYGKEKFINEFSKAAISSFTDFKDQYKEFLLVRDETNFRKAGHKIKPVTQMLGLDLIIEEYEHAKTLIWDEKPDEELQKSADKVEDICDRVIKELEEEI